MQNNIKIMCTVTLNINEAQARKFNPSLKDMEAITRWAQKIIDDILADNHISRSKEETLKPYTIEELHARIDKAEREIAAGLGTPHEEVMRRSRERLARTEAEAKELTLRRGRDIKAGRAKLIPHEEVMQEMEQMLAGYEA